MLENELDDWERDFRAAAQADGCAIFRDHLRRLDLPDNPEFLLEGTIHMVRRLSPYASMDNRDEAFGQFLRMQTYNPLEAKDARYAFTFDLCRKAFARVLVETKSQTLDLADLYGCPWREYEVVGFRRLWISHPDWSNLTTEVVRQLEKEVTDDLRFDYSEAELDFWFDDSLNETYLFVTVQDVYEAEDEDED